MRQLIRKWLGINDEFEFLSNWVYHNNDKIKFLENSNSNQFKHYNVLNQEFGQRISNLESSLQTQKAINNVLTNDVKELNDLLDICGDVIKDMHEALVLVDKSNRMLDSKINVSLWYNDLMKEISNHKANNNGTKKATKKAKKKAK